MESLKQEKIDNNKEKDVSSKKVFRANDKKEKNKIKINNYNISNNKQKSLNFKQNYPDSSNDISSGVRLNVIMSNT